MESKNLEKFSLLIVLYINDEALALTDCLNSISQQTLLPSQIVFVFNGPIHNLSKVVLNNFSTLSKIEIKEIFLSKNFGLGFALNEGLKHCKYNLVARMDPDDICRADRFYLQISKLSNNPEIDVLGSNVSEFTEFVGDLDFTKNLPEDYDSIVNYAKFRNPLNHPTVIFRKDKILQVGSYEDVPLFEDYYLWLKVIKNKGIVVNMSEKLVYFRFNKKLISRRRGFLYLIKEFNFLKLCYSNGLINFRLLVLNIFIKLPFRILPITIFEFFFKKVLRKKSNGYSINFNSKS